MILAEHPTASEAHRGPVLLAEFPIGARRGRILLERSSVGSRPWHLMVSLPYSGCEDLTHLNAATYERALSQAALYLERPLPRLHELVCHVSLPPELRSELR